MASLASHASHAQADAALTGRWLALFPLFYLVHIGEEYLGGFPERTAELTGLPVTPQAFLAANALLLLVMAGAVSWSGLRGGPGWIAVALATIVLVNTALHLAGAMLTGSYSPGLTSGLLLWAPLGCLVLMRARQKLWPVVVRRGVLAGIAVHLLVPVVGMLFVLLLA